MLDPAVTRRLIDAYVKQPPAAALTVNDFLSVLTPRERDVAAEVARGASNAQIARALGLGLTETSVKAHISRILDPTGKARNTVQV